MNSILLTTLGIYSAFALSALMLLYLIHQELVELRLAAIHFMNAGASRLTTVASREPQQLSEAQAPQIHVPSSIMPWQSQPEGDEE